MRNIPYYSKLFLFLIICLITSKMFAQDSLKKIAVTYTPQFLLIHSIKIDIECNINKSKHWIILSPQVYSGTLFFKNTRNYDYSYAFYNENYKDVLLGYGIGLSHKMFLQQKPDRGIYVNNGVSYHYFTLTRKEYDWVTYTENGLEYYSCELTDGEDDISKYSVFSQIGYRAIGGNAFVFDIYWGAGFSFSEKKSTNPDLRNYERYPWDYGYTGIFPSFGIKLGAYL